MNENLKLTLIGAGAILFVGLLWVVLEQSQSKSLKDVVDLQLERLNTNKSFQQTVLDANPESLKKCFKENIAEACADTWKPLKIPYYGQKSSSNVELAGFYSLNNKRCNDIQFSGSDTYRNWKTTLQENGKNCPGIVMTYWKINKDADCKKASSTELCLPIMLTYALQWFEPSKNKPSVEPPQNTPESSDLKNTEENAGNS